MSKDIIIANITWNPDGWRNLYINPLAGHRYVRDIPGHESLNFKFDKPTDKNGRIHGYVQWTYPPKKFLSGGLIFFYSRNLKTKYGEIVGIYGNAEILRSPIRIRYAGFENNMLLANIIADERYSMLFPIPLSENRYKRKLKAKRLVPQIGFRLVSDINLARTIVSDEIVALTRSGIKQTELLKLLSIYEYITGEAYDLETQFDNDAKEQDEIVQILRKRTHLNKHEIRKNLKNLKPTDPERILLKGNAYKRDNKTIAELKFLRDFKCQICNKQIVKKDGNLYVEAAHVKPKSKKGRETPDNILILCPNHHKEFDLGKRQIIKHTKDIISFKLNGINYSVKIGI